MTASDHSARIGSEVGPRARVTHLLSTSAIGASFAAESSEHGQVVVDLLEARFSAELGAEYVEGARRAATIAHPAAVPVLEHGVTSDGAAFVIRPQWDGETAAALISRRPARIPPVEALRLIGDLLDVVTAAHDHGIVHGALTTRDVLIVDDGSVRLLGLGWNAVWQRVSARLEALALPVGFTAPERVGDLQWAANEACDVWSVGAVLFALLTGEVPYEGKTEAEQRRSALERPPRTLTELFGDSSLALARLVDTALDPDPERRFGPARMRALVRDIAQLPELFLLRDLRSQQSKSPISGPRRSPSAEPPRPSSRPAPPAEYATSRSVPSSVPPSGVRPPTHPDTVEIAFRSAATVPAMNAPTRGGVADTVPAMPRVESPAPSARRRRVADVLVGEATASEADVRVLTELFARLERALIARMSGEMASAEALHELSAGASAALGASQGGFVWNVAPWGFSAGAHAVWEPRDAISEVPYRLYRDGVRSFGLLSGIDAAELAKFVEVLAVSDAELLPEDDRVTLLIGAGFEHLVVRAIEVPASEPAERRQAAARQRQHIVALALFDTAAQLEECWHESHKAGDRWHAEPVVSIGTAGDEVARRGLEARFASEAARSAERIGRAAAASLNVATQAGAADEVARHLGDRAPPAGAGETP